MRYQNRATERTLVILEMVSDAERSITLSEIARRVELRRATAFRHLKVLERKGFVIQTKDKSWLPGHMLFRLGRRERQWRTLGQLIEPTALRLAHQFNCIIHVGVLEGTQVVYVRKIVMHDDHKTFTREGMRLDAHATALGKAMLAFRPEKEVRSLYRYRRLERYTDRTISTIERLLAELRQVRIDLYATERSESVTGLHCVAAPVINTIGTSNIAISASGPVSRFTPEAMERIGCTMRSAATEFTKAVVSRDFVD